MLDLFSKKNSSRHVLQAYSVCNMCAHKKLPARGLMFVMSKYIYAPHFLNIFFYSINKLIIRNYQDIHRQRNAMHKQNLIQKHTLNTTKLILQIFTYNTAREDY